MNGATDPDLVDLVKEADFTLGKLRVRPSAREVINGGTEVLEPRVMQVLVYWRDDVARWSRANSSSPSAGPAGW